MRSRKDERWLAVAARLAAVSTMRQRHGAVLVSGSRVLAASCNVHRNSPLVCSDPKSESSLHAEAALLKRLEDIPKRSTLYVARINPQGKMMLSAPCESCYTLIKKVPEITSIVWSTSEEDVVWTE